MKSSSNIKNARRILRRWIKCSKRKQRVSNENKENANLMKTLSQIEPQNEVRIEKLVWIDIRQFKI